MSGYGTLAWTCGQCGERFESSGVIGDLRVEIWRGWHLAEHREKDYRDAVTPEAYARFQAELARAELEEFERRSRNV